MNKCRLLALCDKPLLEAEIVGLQELLRGTGANRYWEGRWRDGQARIERLEALVQEGLQLRERMPITWVERAEAALAGKSHT